MAELPANSCYKYLHIIITCSTTATDHGVASSQQLQHNIMSKLPGYSCYKYLQVCFDPWLSGSLFLYVYPHSG